MDNRNKSIEIRKWTGEISLYLMEDVYQLCIGWIKKDQVSKGYGEDLSYSYHVMGSKRLL